MEGGGGNLHTSCYPSCCVDVYNQATSRGGIVEHDSAVPRSFVLAFNVTIDLQLVNGTMGNVVIILFPPCLPAAVHILTLAWKGPTGPIFLHKSADPNQLIADCSLLHV